MRFSAPHTQAQNGVAEREWNTLVDMATAMLSDAGLDKKFWGAAMLHSAFVRNVCPASSVSSTSTPFEMIHGKPFDVSKLRKFGASSFVHVERAARKKFDHKARRGIYIGHALHNGTHKIYIPDTRRAIESIHVKFIENPTDKGETSLSTATASSGPQRITIDASSTSKLQHPPEPSSDDSASNSTSVSTSDSTSEDSDVGPDNSATGRIDPNQVYPKCDLLTDFDLDSDDIGCANSDVGNAPGNTATALIDPNREYPKCVLLDSDSDDTGYAALPPDPKSLQQARKSPNADKWIAATHEELSSLEANNTWTIVNKHDIPREHRILQSKFIFKTKLDQDGGVARYKARLVALGNLQREGIDYNEVYAPVAHLTTLRVFFAMAANLQVIPKQMDVVTAFLQSDGLNETIYVAPPHGLGMDSDQVFLLNKPIYGLKLHSSGHRQRCQPAVPVHVSSTSRTPQRCQACHPLPPGNG